MHEGLIYQTNYLARNKPTGKNQAKENASRPASSWQRQERFREEEAYLIVTERESAEPSSATSFAERDLL